MRNLFLLPFAILNLAVWSGANIAPASAGQSDPIANINGAWTLRYNFACTGATTPTTITFNANGTFTNGTSTGKWAFSGDTIRFTFDSNGTAYTGVEYNASMKGRSAAANGSFYGCWTATKVGAPLSANSSSKLGPDGSRK
ncbi:MAG: glycoside hydrolase family 43 C-terminal domain-containing protein [Thermosynechococcaceae cyanobacterium]